MDVKFYVDWDNQEIITPEEVAERIETRVKEVKDCPEEMADKADYYLDYEAGLAGHELLVMSPESFAEEQEKFQKWLKTSIEEDFYDSVEEQIITV